MCLSLHRAVFVLLEDTIYVLLTVLLIVLQL